MKTIPKILIVLTILSSTLLNCSKSDNEYISEVDTLYIFKSDTIYYFQYDTTYHFDTVYQYDTLVLYDTIRPDDILSYKHYFSLLNQAGEGDPVETVFINDLDLTISWSRISDGIFEGYLSRQLNINKASIEIRLQETDNIATGGFLNPGTIGFHVVNRYNLYDSRDFFQNAQIDIKVYN